MRVSSGIDTPCPLYQASSRRPPSLLHLMQGIPRKDSEMQRFICRAPGRLLLASFVAWCSLHGLASAGMLRYELLPSTARTLDDYNARGQMQESLRESDAFRELGYLPGGDSVYPYAANDQGQIVGVAT